MSLRSALFYLPAIIAVFLVKNNVFFWDTIQLGAKQGWWIYENGFGAWILPEEIDSGHPPAFGMYLALMWKIFGRTLSVSHLAMLPFLLGIIFFASRIGEFLGGARFSSFFLLLLYADPTLAAQAVLISPDLLLVLGFLAGLYGIFRGKALLIMASALLLAMISTRGMMVVVALYLFDLLRSRLPGAPDDGLPFLKATMQKTWPRVPAGLFALAFLSCHYTATGWIGYHPHSPWAPTFERVDFSGFLFNTGILGWRLLDYGRLFLWIVLFALLLRKFRRHRFDYRSLQFLLLLGITLIVLSPSLLLHKYLLNHRYLLPIYISLTLAAVFFLFDEKALQARTRNFLYALVFLGLLTGNLWIYPKKIAQGWDATLAHLPHYALRRQLFEELDRRNIPYDQVGTAFPEIGPLKYHDLSGRTPGFAEKDLSGQQYIFYANTMNDFSDEELMELEENWRELLRLETGGVCMILYEREAD